ncbi:MAG: TolC family protein, partial [Thermoguttaceae bacterium]
MDHYHVLPVLALLAALPFAARGEAPAENVPTAPPLALAAQIDLETALQWTLQSNPNLIATRQNLRVSAEALNVAQHFPMTLNPSVSIDYAPWVFERQANGEVQSLDRSVVATWAQPIELGHRQSYREQMARASYSQTRWNVLQVELAALIQTYRFHQTALYRREKLGIAQDLNTFST